MSYNNFIKEAKFKIGNILSFKESDMKIDTTKNKQNKLRTPQNNPKLYGKVSDVKIFTLDNDDDKKVVYIYSFRIESIKLCKDDSKYFLKNNNHNISTKITVKEDNLESYDGYFLKTLVVVDVQNCFISGGSYGGHENNSIDGNKLVNSINQVMEISDLIDKNESIIFTRDYHPINHLSIAVKNRVTLNYGATHPSHCLNIQSNCPRNNNLGLPKNEMKKIKSRNYISIEDYLEEKINIIKFKNNKNNKNNINELKEAFLEIPNYTYKEKIIGTNLSWLYYITKYKDIIYKLIKDDKYIGIKKSENKNKDPDFSKITIPKPYKKNNKEFIQLVKGQLCSYESYSAFNYHLHLEKSSNRASNELIKYNSKYITNEYFKGEKLKNLSTGLFEYILDSTNKNIIEITICGLVGEICVINTITEGLIMWNLFYKDIYGEKSVKFNYSLYGTLFTGLGLYDFDKTPIQSYDTFVNKMTEFLNNNIKNEYKKFIEFNIIDYDNEYFGFFYYNYHKSMIDFEPNYKARKILKLNYTSI